MKTRLFHTWKDESQDTKIFSEGESYWNSSEYTLHTKNGHRYCYVSYLSFLNIALLYLFVFSIYIYYCNRDCDNCYSLIHNMYTPYINIVIEEFFKEYRSVYWSAIV